MAKAVILKEATGMKSFEKLYCYLKKNPDKAELLGFKEIPSRRTLSHFFNERISTDAKRLILLFAEALRNTLGIFQPNVPENASERTLRRKKEQYLKLLCKFIKENLLSMIPLRMNGNCLYSKEDLLNLLLHMSITSDFAENGSKTFRKVNGRSMSGDTLLYHLKKLEVKEIEEAFDKIIGRPSIR